MKKIIYISMAAAFGVAFLNSTEATVLPTSTGKENTRPNIMRPVTDKRTQNPKSRMHREQRGAANTPQSKNKNPHVNGAWKEALKATATELQRKNPQKTKAKWEALVASAIAKLEKLKQQQKSTSVDQPIVASSTSTELYHQSSWHSATAIELAVGLPRAMTNWEILMLRNSKIRGGRYIALECFCHFYLYGIVSPIGRYALDYWIMPLLKKLEIANSGFFSPTKKSIENVLKGEAERQAATEFATIDYTCAGIEPHQFVSNLCAELAEEASSDLAVNYADEGKWKLQTLEEATWIRNLSNIPHPLFHIFAQLYSLGIIDVLGQEALIHWLVPLYQHISGSKTLKTINEATFNMLQELGQQAIGDLCIGTSYPRAWLKYRCPQLVK
ncbi:MAG: hypothetical protein K6C34_04220 [Alphaproteobacteria bacterium]|nr:hypothetical protein [Alphaproteobacteria bacterium]